MTDRYKINLLNYVLNNIEPTNPTYEEIINGEDYIAREEWENFLPENAAAIWIENIISANELSSSYSILYGGFVTDAAGDDPYGIIILVDENFKPVKTIYNFSSGTPLRYIQCMAQAEDGTFYYIDDSMYSHSQPGKTYNSQKRFVMVNNFTLIDPMTSDYSISLRKSYVFGSSFQNFLCREIYKDPNSSHYVMFGQAAYYANSSYSYRSMRVFDLKINVGSANQWNELYSSTFMLFGGAFVLFDSSSNVSFRALMTSILNSSSDIKCISKTYTGNVTTSTIATYSFNPFVDSYRYKNQCVFLSMDSVYFVQNNQHWGNDGVSEPKYIGLYKYDFGSSILTTIYEKSLGNYDFANIEAIYITKCDTDIYIQYNTNINIIPERPSDYTADYYYQRLVNDEWNPQLIQEGQNFAFSGRGLSVISKFNLLLIYIWQGNMRVPGKYYQYLLKEDYNALNYNGEPYINYNALIPYKGEIFSNNNLVFARNLYNKTVYNNMTVATLQIPNTYLNNVNLDQQVLLGETNNSLVVNYDSIQKNIYEVLLLNFINTINVIDEDENRLYPLAANYINSNINVGTQANCEGSYIGKARITKNGTTIVQPIFWQDIDNTHKKTEITLYVDEMITSLELISNDETITYLTKDLSSLETEKTYTITQYLRVE